MLTQSQFALPRPLTYASGQDIPFILRIRSTCTTEAISLLLSSLSVQLCRVMIISSREKWTRKETVLAGGEVYQIEEHGQERVMHGNITCPNVTGESSWELAGLQVKVTCMKVTSPPILIFCAASDSNDVGTSKRPSRAVRSATNLYTECAHIYAYSSSSIRRCAGRCSLACAMPFATGGDRTIR